MCRSTSVCAVLKTLSALELVKEGTGHLLSACTDLEDFEKIPHVLKKQSYLLLFLYLVLVSL